MRNMSFMLTTEQIRNRTKTVTRRLGWLFLKPGDMVMACVQCQGLTRGEKIQRITPIRIVSTWMVPLDPISPEDVVHEGFPALTPAEFVDMFCREMRCDPWVPVNRIEFEYVEVPDVT